MGHNSAALIFKGLSLLGSETQIFKFKQIFTLSLESSKITKYKQIIKGNEKTNY